LRDGGENGRPDDDPFSSEFFEDMLRAVEDGTIRSSFNRKPEARDANSHASGLRLNEPMPTVRGIIGSSRDAIRVRVAGIGRRVGLRRQT